MKTFADLAAERYSCRAYDAQRPIDDATLADVFASVRLAPSACNRQPWTFIVVRDPERRAKLLAKSRPAFVNAPVVIVCCGHHPEAWQRPADGKDHTDIDLAIAIEHLCLAATDAGLASCWVCSFDTETARRECLLPADVEPVALIPLGYAAHGTMPQPKTRKPLSDIMRCETF